MLFSELQNWNWHLNKLSGHYMHIEIWEAPGYETVIEGASEGVLFNFLVFFISICLRKSNFKNIREITNFLSFLNCNSNLGARQEKHT